MVQSTMALVCEDLARYGAVLIPPPAAEYFELLADIERRLHNRPVGAPPVEVDAIDTAGSAILLNRSDVAIASMAYIWSFPGRAGRIFPHRCLPGTNPSVLLPFGLDHRGRKFGSFWNTIFPTSKRLLTCHGLLLGDNTDVRQAEADELWQGGFFCMSGGSRTDDWKPLKLTLDGVFFIDGGFAGLNRLGAWEHTVFAAQAYVECGTLAREGRKKGMPAAEFFARVQALTGQVGEDPPIPPRPSLESKPPDPEPIRKHERRLAGWRVLSMRMHLGEEAVIDRIEAWVDAPVPKFHRL